MTSTEPLKDRQPKTPHVVRNTLLGGVQQVLSMVVGLFLFPYLLVRLGTEAYGYLATVQLLSLTGLLAYADLGLQSAVTRYLSQYYVQHRVEEFRTLLSTTIFAFLGVGAIAGLAVVLFSLLLFFRVFPVLPGYQSEVRWCLLIYAGGFLLQFPGLIVRGFFAGVHDLVRLRTWEIAERLCYAGAVVIVLQYSRSIVAVVATEQIVLGILAVLWTLSARRRYRELFTIRARYWSWSSLAGTAHLSMHVFLNRLAFVLYQKGPEVLIASRLGATSMTYYAIVKKIPLALKSVQAAVNMALSPAAGALDALEMRAKLGRLVLWGARYCYLILTPMVTFLLVFADRILLLWVGPSFVFLAPLLRAMLAWQYMMFLSDFLNSTLTRSEQYARILPWRIAASVVLLAVIAGGLATFGLWSVAVALLLNGALTLGGTIQVQRRWLEITSVELYRYVLRVPIVAGALGSTALFLLARLTLPIRGLVSLSLVFAFFCLAYGSWVYASALGTEERSRLLSVLRRSLRA